MKKLFTILLAITMAASLLTGCGGQAATSPNPESTSTPVSSSDTESSKVPDEAPNDAPVDDDKFAAQIYFNGSTSLSPIIASIAQTFTDEYVTWDKADSSFPDDNISIYVAAGGSGVGVKAVVEGTTDFGMLARDVKDGEKESIPDYHEYIVAKDALTISVNKENPVAELMEDISTDLARQIFAGELKFWDEVDPSLPHEEIVVVIRDLSGGAYEVFQKNVMGETQISADAIQSPSMGALATKIVENKWAIGYAGYGVYNKNKENLHAFKVDGVEPSEENIVSGEYKIQRPVLFIQSGEPTPAQQKFIDYIYSDIGTKAITDNGYIPSK